MSIDLRNTQKVAFLTTAERTALSATEGLVVWDTELKHYFYWDSVQWVEY
jgi:hypothetical protein